jgi:hypothetical protein
VASIDAVIGAERLQHGRKCSGRDDDGMATEEPMRDAIDGVRPLVRRDWR